MATGDHRFQGTAKSGVANRDIACVPFFTLVVWRYFQNDLQQQRGEKMSRPKTACRMSLKGRDGVTVRIGFAPQADGRWAVYRDGRRSNKTPSLNATQVGDLVSRWLRRQAETCFEAVERRRANADRD